MHKLLQFASVAAIIAALGAAAASSAATPAPAPGPKPTIVLVHGAFAESDSWNGVISILTRDGYPVIAAANPLRGVKYDADYVSSLLASIDGPVVLVGHSYGGFVISGAAVGHANVKGLVYVDGFEPDAGETAAGLGERFPGATLGPALAPPVPLPGGGGDLYIRLDRFHEQFAADVPAADAALMAATQRPIAASAFVEPAGEPAWKTIPSWSIYGSADRNITPAALAFMAERARARKTVAIPGASHVSMVSHPREVAALIEEAARAGS